MKRKTFIKELIIFATAKDPSVLPFIEKYRLEFISFTQENKATKKRKKQKRAAGYEIPAKFTKETYAKYLETPLWRGIRDRVFKLRGKKCEGCQATTKLQVHHTTYTTSIFKGNSIRGLRVVCETCHGKIHALKANGMKLPNATREVLDSKPYVYNPTIKIYKSTTNEVEVLKKMAKKIKY